MDKTLYEGQRISMHDSISLTIASMQTYGPRFLHWAIAWSGGKDSSATLTLIVYLIIVKKIPCPKSLTVLYADTRLELPPLVQAAADMRAELLECKGQLAAMGCELTVLTVLPDLDHRFFTYMFGRGVPTPGAHFRWCTGMLKITPMEQALRDLHAAKFAGGAGKFLTITGVRQGESAMRDGRIAMSCGRDGAECGQGWYQETLQNEISDTLAPLLHWRVCHIWEWLKHWAPASEFGDWSTATIADAYGGDEAEEINARTGCICCPVASQDKALNAILKNPSWSYLAPLLELRDLFEEMRLAKHRLRKPPGEKNSDGRKVRNQARKGPLVFEARRMGLERVLEIQGRVNAAAEEQHRPTVSLINADEWRHIEELIDAGTWPSKWTGNEPSGECPEHLELFEECQA
jgi:DNA sulfur modification protein DndC